MKKLALFFTVLLLTALTFSISAFAEITSQFYVDDSLNDVYSSSQKYEFLLRNGNGRAIDKEFMKKYRFSISFIENSRYATISTKLIDDDYHLVIQPRASTEQKTVVFTVTLTNRSDPDDYYEQEYAITVNFDPMFVYEEFYDVDNNKALLEFDDRLARVELSFENGVTYKANLGNKVKYNLVFNENRNQTLIKQYDVDMLFVNFTAEPTFEHEGTITFPKDQFSEGKYAYLYSGGNLIYLGNSTNDRGDLSIKTKTLGYFVLTSEKLNVGTAITTTGATTAGAGGIFSPSTTKASTQAPAATTTATTKAGESTIFSPYTTTPKATTAATTTTQAPATTNPGQLATWQPSTENPNTGSSGNTGASIVIAGVLVAAFGFVAAKKKK